MRWMTLRTLPESGLLIRTAKWKDSLRKKHNLKSTNMRKFYNMKLYHHWIITFKHLP